MCVCVCVCVCVCTHICIWSSAASYLDVVLESVLFDDAVVCGSVKRDLLRVKRDLFTWQKRPTNTLAYLRYAYE